MPTKPRALQSKAILLRDGKDVVHLVVDSKCHQCETDVREELLETVGLTICVVAGHDAHNELAV
jgi:hypothetical protein